MLESITKLYYKVKFFRGRTNKSWRQCISCATPGVILIASSYSISDGTIEPCLQY